MKVSSGAVVWRVAGGGLLAGPPGDDDLEVLIVHPGGPFFAKKDLGAWSIPKGEVEDGHEPLETAIRELQEECGLAPETAFEPLGAVKQKSGKVVHAFAVDGADLVVPTGHRPPQVRVEWPPRSGKELAFDEVDQVRWVALGLARAKLNPAQVELLDRLVAHLAKAF
ncbi:MAG: NUDIX domain-containing protein [Myxococcota bacterium]